MSRIALFLTLTLTACESARAGSGSPTEGDGWVEVECAYDADARGFTADVGDSFPPPIVQAWLTSAVSNTIQADRTSINPDGVLVLDYDASNAQDFACTVYVWG